MTKEGGDDHDFETGATNATPEQTAAIYAAMMEELGIARKDTLPLEDKKGTGGHVDLNALDRDKKANNPRTAEFRIAQRNASAHSAWKTAVFDDVDEADLELDQMNSGQSHRQRMKAELEASNSSRGSFATRGGRGGQFTRGGGSHSASRNNLGGFSGHITTKPVQVDIGKVLTRLGGHLGPRGRANRGTRGSLPRDIARPFKPAEIVIAPKSNLSFGDNRSVTALPFGRDISKKSASVSEKGSREPQAASKVVKRSNYTQGFALASPEEFFAHSWIGRSRNDVFIEHTEEKMAPSGLPDQAQTPKTVVDNTSGTEMRSPAAVAAPSTVSTGVQKPPEKPIVESLVDNSNDIFHPIPVQVANEIRGNVVMIGPGSVCIKAVDQSPNIAKIIQVVNRGKRYLEEPLLGSFEYKLDLCTISFYSGFEANRTKWILTASHPGIAASLAEAFERLKPQSTNVESVGAPVKDHANNVEERENLISFSDEDSTPQQAVSQFTEDLFSLMGAEFIAHAVNAINLNIGQNYASEAESGVPGTCEAELTQTQPKTFRGLAASRFANQVEVGDFLNRSAIFQKLPDSTAAYIREQVSKGVFEETQKDSHDQGVFRPIMKRSRIQYSFKTLMCLRFHPNSSKKPLGLDLHITTTPKGDPRRLFSFPELDCIVPEGHGLPGSETNTQSNLRTTCLGVPIVSDCGIPRKLPGLAASKSASSHTVVTAQESTKSKEQEPSALEFKPETFPPQNTDPRLLRPIQGLSASKYAGPTAKSREREHLNLKKPRSSSEKPTQAFASSNGRQNCALKEFKSFLNLQENQPPRRRPSERLSNSDHPSTSYVKPLLELPAPSYSKASPPLKPLKELPPQDLREPFARKPYQGLASSKYASPLPTTHSATKTNLSALLQSGPKIPSVITKSLIMNTVVPDLSDEKISPTGTVALADVPRSSIFSMIMSSKEGRNEVRNAADHEVLNEILGNGVPLSLQSGGSNTLRRRDSLNSHASKDSNETVKPLVSKPSIQTVRDHAALIQCSRATSGHQSILSMDSSVSSESFVTAIEETSTEGKAPDTNNQSLVKRVQSCHFEPEMPNLFLFPDDAARPEAHGKEQDTKSLYSSDMSELMRDSLPAAAQRDPSNAKLASPFQPFNVSTVQPRKFVIKPHRGLQSSRYATPTENIAPATTKAKPQQLSTTLPNEVKQGSETEGIAPMPPIHKFEPNASSRDLKPTASNFTPSATRSRNTQARNGPPPIMSTFSPPIQPVIATVFVPDPHNPGMLVEVSGLLKLGSTPVVGYVAAAESPMGESLVSGSRPDNMVLSQRALLPTLIQNSKNIKDTQKEVQERLTKSLMERRLS